MSDIVWANVLMLSTLSFGVLMPTSFLIIKLFKIFDSKLFAYISKRNNVLSRIVNDQSGKLRRAGMIVSQAQLENSKLLSERKDMINKVDNAISRVNFIDGFFGQFFSSLDFEVIMVLVDKYPETISSKELSNDLDVSTQKAYAVANQLFKQKWLNKSKTKGFPRTCVWSLKQQKFDVLSKVFD
ncbi:MAG: hypothetical protein GON13_02600 [Nanoarchaeota archaeon]|nr:hypothetical protein [Nanoarchaeota archaeon]